MDDARRFALAIYEQDSEKLSLPEPETLIANVNDGS
jgi:hypothetical protein